jgi:MIP family channel proteins
MSSTTNPSLDTVDRTQPVAEQRGLHGHSLEANMLRVAVTEALGTFALVLAITSTAIAATLAKPVAGVPYGSLAVPLAGGFALAGIVVSLGHISGAHLNPAVTLGLAVNRRFPWTYVPAYLLAQFAGATVAALVTWALYGDQARTIANLGATYPAPGVGGWRTFATEAVATMLLVIVIVSVASNPKLASGLAGLAIGFSLSVAILISGPLTGAGVNPARAIGPMIPAGRFTDWFAYLAGPLLGGTAAVWLYNRIISQGTQP